MEFTEAEVAAFRAEYGRGATDSQWELYLSDCKARSLRPGVHSVFQLRNAKEWDPETGSSRYVKKGYSITTIGALRLIALRTGQYDGSSSPEYIYLDEKNEPTIISQIPLPDKTNKTLPREPWAVRVSVRRKDFSQPITSIVRFDSVAATQKRGETIVLTDMWVKRGDAQNAKCSEADALRKAFPEELGSLYLSEEIKNEEEPQTPTAVTPASVVPLPPSVPKVDQTPAVGKEEPRPNETVKVEHHVTNVPATLPAHSGSVLIVKDPISQPDEAAIEAAKKAVPDLKPASALPPPEKKKRGPKPKESPVNGQDIASEGGITDADIPTGPAPEAVDEAPAAQEFVASLDPTPTQEEMKGFTARVRALTAKGIKSDYIKSRVLLMGGVEDTKLVTVGAWRRALDELETPPVQKAATELGAF